MMTDAHEPPVKKVIHGCGNCEAVAEYCINNDKYLCGICATLVMIDAVDGTTIIRIKQ